MYAHTLSLTRTLPPPPPPVSWHNPRCHITPLMKSAQWNHTAGGDAHAYPSPPMTTSPASPKVSHIQEDRQHRTSSIHEFTNPAAAAIGPATRTSYVAEQSLPVPFASSPQHVFSTQSVRSQIGHCPDLHSRPRAQSIPSYQLGYQASAYVQPPMMSLQSQIHLGPSLARPISIGMPIVGRIPRSGSRRAKAHVARACQNCKKAHLSCDESRPCARCVATRKESSCIDVEHKKRGRPRIQPDRGQTRRPLLTTSGPLLPAPSHSAPEAHSSRPYGSFAHDQRRTSLPAGHSIQPWSLHPRLDRGSYSISAETGTVQQSLPPRTFWRSDLPTVAAFLSMDLRIIKAMEAFKYIFAGGGGLIGHNLDAIVFTNHRPALRWFQTQLRDERLQREPTFLPGIGQHEEFAVQHLTERDIDQITKGSFDRYDKWTFHVAAGRSEVFNVRLRLARTSSYFTVLELQQIPSLPSPTIKVLNQPLRIDSNDANAYTHSHGFGCSIQTPLERLSLFAQSTPSSPSSSLPQHAIAGPPLRHTQSISTNTHVSSSPSRETRSGCGSYYSRPAAPLLMELDDTLQPSPAASMRPPPHPQQSFAQCLESTRHHRRSDSLTNAQLVPIGRGSAPTTPICATFPHSQISTPRIISTPENHSCGSSRESVNECIDEDSARKRRRLNIGEIIDK